MIITPDLNPQNNLYFIGGQVLKILQQNELKIVDISWLYEKIKQSTKIGFSSFMYALDWLFILDLIETNNDGNIIKCF